jgi:hypothetical protein
LPLYCNIIIIIVVFVVDEKYGSCGSPFEVLVQTCGVSVLRLESVMVVFIKPPAAEALQVDTQPYAWFKDRL